MSQKRQAVPGNFETVRLALQLFAQDEDGVTAIEYALLGSLIAVGAVVGIATVGDRLDGMWTQISALIGAAL